jgi:hypothetical protein
MQAVTDLTARLRAVLGAIWRALDAALSEPRPIDADGWPRLGDDWVFQTRVERYPTTRR